MHKEEIDNKIIELRKRLKQNQEEQSEVTQEIDDLTWQLDDLENQRYRLEKQEIKLTKEVEGLEKQITDKNFDELDNTMTDDKFRDSFIKCSFFCRKYESFNEKYDDPLRYVKITENKLLALDGSRGIIIRCNDIPDELKNTYVKWSVRDDFKNHIKEDNFNDFGLEKFIEEGKSDIKIKLKQDKFLENLLFKELVSGKEIVILKYYDRKVAFDKSFIDTMLMVFKGMELTVYYPRDRYSPMVIEGDNQKAVLLPMRLDDSQY